MGVTRLVRQDGSGAYLDHASAFLACGAGDTVETGDSETYAEQVTIYALAGLSWVVSTGCTPTVTFDSGNTVTVNDGATGLTINGLTLDNSGPHSCLHLLGESTGLMVEACAFTGSAATAISGAFYVAGQDVSMLGCDVTCATGLYASVLAAVDIAESTFSVTNAALLSNTWQGTIDRCEVYLTGAGILTSSIAASGTYSGAVRWSNCLIVDLADATATGVMPIWDTTSPYEILGCDMIGASAWVAANVTAIWMDVQAAHLGQIAIQGSILTGFLTALRGNYGTYTDDYNDVWGNGTNYGPGTAAGAHSISADPLFVGGGDYRLSSGSTCLNASTDLGLTEDLEGNPRPSVTGRYDIGAYNGFDDVPPRVSLAEAVDEYTVDVTFSEPVTGADLTDATLWSVVEQAEAEALDLVSVSVVSGSQVRIVLDDPLRPTTLYRATAPSTVEDVAGNVIAAGARDALFRLVGTLAGAGLQWTITLDGEPVGEPIDLFPAVAGDAVVSLVSASLISLLTDRRARDDEAYPRTPRVDRRGWWATAFEADNDEIGSGLWIILERGKIVDSTPAEVEAEAVACHQWMVRDGLCASVSATAERMGRNGIALVIDIVRNDGRTLSLRFADLWAALEALNG